MLIFKVHIPTIRSKYKYLRFIYLRIDCSNAGIAAGAEIVWIISDTMFIVRWSILGAYIGIYPGWGGGGGPPWNLQILLIQGGGAEPHSPFVRLWSWLTSSSGTQKINFWSRLSSFFFQRFGVHAVVFGVWPGLFVFAGGSWFFFKEF